MPVVYLYKQSKFMKQIILPALVAMLVMIASCSKDPVNNSSLLNASKTTAIKKGEAVLFTFTNTQDTIKWSVKPATTFQVTANGSLATIRFGSGGTFTVVATSGTKADSTIVSVDDSVYTPPAAATLLPFNTAEQINIAVSKLDSGASSGLIFYALTHNSYACITNYLSSDFNLAGAAYTIDFKGVFVPAGCTTGTARAGAFAYLLPMTDGTHTLAIKLNNTTYTGSVVKAGSNYTINWSYTSGVAISPSTL